LPPEQAAIAALTPTKNSDTNLFELGIAALVKSLWHQRAAVIKIQTKGYSFLSDKSPIKRSLLILSWEIPYLVVMRIDNTGRPAKMQWTQGWLNPG